MRPDRVNLPNGSATGDGCVNGKEREHDMNAKERAIETFKRLGLMPFHLVHGNLAGPSRKEIRREMI